MAKKIIEPPKELADIPVDAASTDDIDKPYGKERAKLSYHEDRWFFWVRVIFLLVASLGTLSVVLVYLWHLAGPLSARWLPDADIIKLKDLAITIIVGLVMSVTTTYFFKKK